MISEYKDGLTVKELKNLLEDWPETDKEGEPTEIWLLNKEGISNLAVRVGSIRDDLFIQHD